MFKNTILAAFLMLFSINSLADTYHSTVDQLKLSPNGTAVLTANCGATFNAKYTVNHKQVVLFVNTVINIPHSLQTKPTVMQIIFNQHKHVLTLSKPYPSTAEMGYLHGASCEFDLSNAVNFNGARVFVLSK
jgi:hypothetical protein